MSLVDYSSVKTAGKALNFGSGFYLHAVGYFIAAFLFYLVLSEKQNGKMILILLILFGCGILFEIAQGYLPKRTYNPMDIAANGLGLAAFYGFYYLTRIRSKAILNKSSRKGAETLRGK